MFKKVLLALAILMATAPSALAHGGAVFIPIVVYTPPMVPPASRGGYDHIHTMAVVSALGNTMRLQNDHFLGADSRQFDITDWKIDDLVTAMVQKYLAPRFAFKPVNVDRAAIASLRNGPLDNTYEDVRRVLKTVSAAGVDAFMVIRPDLEADTLGLQGLTYEHVNTLAGTSAGIWANYEIDVYDANSMALVAKAYSRLHLPHKPVWFASLPAPKGLELDDNLSLSPEQRDLLHDSMRKLITASLIDTLSTLQFGVTLPGDWVRRVTPIPPERDPYRAAKTIAIVSAFGNQVAFNDGGTVTEETLPGANIDAQIENQLREMLSKRYTVVPAGVDRAQIQNAGLTDDRGGFDPHFPGLSPSPGIDLYVVLFRKNGAVWDGAKAQGVGIENHNTNGRSDTAVFANYSAVVLDAHTLALRAMTDGVGDNPDNPKPLLAVDDGLWAKPPAVPTAEAAARLQTELMRLMSRSLDNTMLLTGIQGVTTTYSKTPNPAADALAQ